MDEASRIARERPDGRRSRVAGPCGRKWSPRSFGRGIRRAADSRLLLVAAALLWMATCQRRPVSVTDLISRRPTTEDKIRPSPYLRHLPVKPTGGNPRGTPEDISVSGCDATVVWSIVVPCGAVVEPRVILRESQVVLSVSLEGGSPTCATEVVRFSTQLRHLASAAYVILGGGTTIVSVEIMPRCI